MKKDFFKLFLLSALSGVLLSLPWYECFPGYFLLLAFIPLLFMEQYYYENRERLRASGVFLFALFCFLIWNAITTYWIKNATLFGAISAIILNSLFFALLFYAYHYTKRKIGKKEAYIALPAYWIAFEYFYLNAEMSWPWLSLGNAFANTIKWVQWYEFTGILGGSLWILIINILIFIIIHEKRYLIKVKRNLPILIVTLLLMVVPIIYSHIRYYNYVEKVNPVDIVVVQPNIDPYKEKFGSMSPADQLQKMLNIAKNKMDTAVSYVVAPETALTGNINEDEIEVDSYILAIRKFLIDYPRTSFITGASTYRIFDYEASYTCRKLNAPGMYYDAYNTALQINKDSISIYHKSKLVVGVEKMPYPKYLKKLEFFSIDLGGISGSLGTQETRDVFKNQDNRGIIAPVVCYESVYGEYLNGYIQNGANLIFVITNDGWWDDTEGFKQHHNYSRLRAIETRRSIARSANTGRSSFINQRGDYFQGTAWWEEAVIRSKLNLNDVETFYVKFGDYIGRIASFTTVLFLLLLFVKRMKQKSGKIVSSK